MRIPHYFGLKAMAARLSALVFALAIAVGTVFAEPYQGKSFTYTQPDGESFAVRLWGDEFFAYQETADGYLLVRDARTGEFCYAKVTGGGDFISTGVRVGRAKPPGLKPKQRLAPGKAMAKSRPLRDQTGVDDNGQLKPELFEKLFPKKGKPGASESGIQSAPAADGATMPSTAMTADTTAFAAGAPPGIDKRVGLVLLASFPDRPGDITKTQSQIDAFCNAPAYTADGNATSIYGYFQIQSSGRVEYKNVVTAWFTAKNVRSYYADDALDAAVRGQELIKEGLDFLLANGFDFTQCNANGDSVIDGVNCFYAGARVSAWSKGLWPHKSGTSWAGFSSQGLSASFQYEISDMPASLPIGTVCHENGHMLFNFPDLYPYDSGAANVGAYSIMSAYDEKHPPNIDPYLKISAGWGDMVELNSASLQRCVVQTDRNRFYRYKNPAKSSESFIFEVRNNNGYEGPYGGAAGSANPTAGLVAYHALDGGSNTATSIFTSQNPNCSYSKPYQLMVIEANPAATVTPWSDDPTPGSNDGFKSTDKNQISDSTTPSLKFWASTGRTIASLAQVQSISAAGETMSFVIGAGTVTAPAEMAVTADGFAAITSQGVDAATQKVSIFNKGSGTFSYTVSANVPWLAVSPGSGSVSTNIDVLTLTFSNVANALAPGTYTAAITVSSPDAVSPTLTMPVTLKVNNLLAAPLITSQPAGANLLGGANYTLSSGASGYPAPYYQWTRNGVAVPGASKSSLTLTNVTAATAGSYQLLAFNLQGQAASNSVVVNVNDAPVIARVTPLSAYATIPANVGLVLQVTATDDNYAGSSLTNSWSVQSAPAGGTVAWDNQNTTSTAATFSVSGDYQLRFTSTDGVNTRLVDYYVSVGASPRWVSTTSQIVQYDFAETSGTTTADGAGGNQNGTLVGGASLSGGKLVLDGTTGYLSIPSGTEIDAAGPYAKRTVALWFKPNAVPANVVQMLYEEGSAVSGLSVAIYGQYLLYRLWNQSGAVATFSSYPSYNAGATLAPGRWNHVALVLDASTGGTALQANAIQFYFNGVLVANQQGVRIDSHADGIAIGGINGTVRNSTNNGVDSNTSYFGGEIKDFRLYNRALTAAEVSTVVEMSNTGPNVDAGPQVTGYAGVPLALDGTVTDDGLPYPPLVTTTWSVVSAPGTSSFADAAAVDTALTTYAVGSYLLRLSANDGKITTFDQTTCSSSVSPGPGQLRFENAGYSFNESAGSVQIGVTRPGYGGVTGAVSVSYAVTAGTAVNGSDFNLPPGTLSWADQESGTKYISFDLVDDPALEAAESFTVSLSNPTGGALILSPSDTTVAITDNEIPDLVLLQDNFNTANTTDPNSNLATRQTGTMATSAFTKELGTTASISGNQLSGPGNSRNINNADFESALTAAGIARFSLSFDMANTGASSWASTYLSTHAGTDDRGSSRFGLLLWNNNATTALSVYGDSGTNQSSTSVSKATLDTLLGASFQANQSHNFSFVATPTSATAGTYDLLINNVKVLSNIPYLLGSGGSNGQINWENFNITGGAALIDNLMIRRTFNSAPAWIKSPLATANAAVGVAYSASLAAAASDGDGQTLTLAKVSGPAWLSVAANGALSGTPAYSDAGINSFTVSVSDGIAAPVQATLSIAVISNNHAPAWITNPVVKADPSEDAAYSATLAGDVSDVDEGSVLSFVKVSGPGWLSVAGNGTLSGTPANSDVGANSFTVSVSDGIAAPVLATLGITVINTNDAPVWTADPILKANATNGLAYSAALVSSAADVDAGAALSFAKVSGPAWLTVAADGALSGTPASGDVGANNFTVSVSDGIASGVQATLTITVVNPNSAPVWSANPVVKANATEAAAYTGATLSGSATDVDAGATFTFAKVSGPAWLSVAASGALSGTPASGDLGLNAFTVSVSDGIAPPVQGALNITVIAKPPFTLLFSDDFNAANGTSLTAPGNRATGTLAGSVPYVWSSTTGVVVDGTLNWDSNNSRDSNNEQTDAAGSQNLRLNFDWAPSVAGKVWEVEFDQRVAWSHPLTFALSDNSQGGLWNAWDSTLYDFAAGSYGQALRYDTDNDGGTNLASLNGVFPSPPNSVDMHRFRIRFDEPNHTAKIWVDNVLRMAVTTLDFENAGRYLSWGEPANYAGALDNLVVKLVNSNSAPAFAANPTTGSDANEDSPYVAALAGSASDYDGDTLAFAKLSGPAWLSVASNGALSGTPTNSDVGANSFTVSLSDGIATAVQATLNINVINTNDAPVWAGNPVIRPNVTANSLYSATLAGSADDVDAGAVLTFAKVSGPSWLSVAANGALSGTPANADVGANSFTVSVSDGIAAPVPATLNISVVAMGFNSYISNPAFGLAAADQGFTADPDKDGLPNGLEAWFGTVPSQSNAGISALSTSGLTTTFTHPRNPNAPGDVSGFYQWSPNLVDWYACDGVAGPAGGPTVTAVPASIGATTTVSATLSATAARLFLRVGVSQN